MKLGALLAAGKSLALGRRGESPYRANKQVYLPKFFSPKNPFAASAETGTETAGLAAASANAAPLKKEAATKTQKLPALPFAVSRQVAAVENPVVTLQKPHRSSKWMSRLNPFASGSALRRQGGRMGKSPCRWNFPWTR